MALRNNRRKDDYFRRSLMPAVLVFLLTAVIVGLTAILTFYPVPQANREILFILYGGILAKFSDAVAYYLGSTHSSQEKSKLLGKQSIDKK